MELKYGDKVVLKSGMKMIITTINNERVSGFRLTRTNRQTKDILSIPLNEVDYILEEE